ncbi:MAG: Holliday junction branch migration protein RuvA [Paludibacteraceae bacterium]|nr:Holliday junction branch migration protein RuvA [Paludibacteraceae bacterium]
MIDYIKGTIAELNPAVCVIENGGMGYAVNISLTSYQALQGANDAKLFIYESIREDAFVLYGFMTKEEREIFLLLISVSGVGAGTARMILSNFSVDELVSAIAGGNVRAIKEVKGIGAKTAERIIVDLKDKVAKVGAVDLTSVGACKAARNEKREEAVAALVALGFQQAQSAKIVDRVLKENGDLSVGAIIKISLKAL